MMYCPQSDAHANQHPSPPNKIKLQADRTNAVAQTPADLGSQLRELDSKAAEERRIRCMALQVHLHKMPQTKIDDYYGSGLPLEWTDLRNEPKPISHRLLRDVAIAAQESKEEYQNQFTEQLVGGERLQLDHSNK